MNLNFAEEQFYSAQFLTFKASDRIGKRCVGLLKPEQKNHSGFFLYLAKSIFR
jgi:hypothetical protein